MVTSSSGAAGRIRDGERLDDIALHRNFWISKVEFINSMQQNGTCRRLLCRETLYFDDVDREPCVGNLSP